MDSKCFVIYGRTSQQSVEVLQNTRGTLSKLKACTGWQMGGVQVIPVKDQ